MKKVDIIGQRFGRLTVISRNGTLGGHSAWLCRCDCGNKKTVVLQNLKSGGVRSCGCLNKEIAPERGRRSKIGERSKIHGDFGTKLYGVWAAMKRRCFNPNAAYYADYGGRGITVCDEWLEYPAFKEWAITTGYAEGMSIERIDVDKGYSPSNCAWIPLKEQNRNKRLTIHLDYQGRSYTIKELSELTGLSERTIEGRYRRGWDIEKIVSTPKQKNQHK